MRASRAKILTLALGGALAGALLGRATPGVAQTLLCNHTSGLVGVDGDQTVRLNIVNAFDTALEFTLEIRDPTGKVVAMSKPMVNPGNAASLSHNPQGSKVYAMIMITTDDNIPCDVVLPTLEVRQAGETEALIDTFGAVAPP